MTSPMTPWEDPDCEDLRNDLWAEREKVSRLAAEVRRLNRELELAQTDRRVIDAIEHWLKVRGVNDA